MKMIVLTSCVKLMAIMVLPVSGIASDVVKKNKMEAVSISANPIVYKARTGVESKAVCKLLTKETSCQIFDEQNGVCQFEKTVYSFAGEKCISKCSHWDEQNERCLFEEKCEYDEEKKEIIFTSCDLFDEQEDRCLKPRTKIWKNKNR